MSKELEIMKEERERLVQEDYADSVIEECDLVIKALERLESIDNSEPTSEALKCFKRIKNLQVCVDYEKDIVKSVNEILPNSCNKVEQALLKAQELEKENELLKEIIKSLFDRGCPLHQYTDKEGVLTIEVDDECSIMRIGIYKGVDLDKKLKEVLE